MNGFLRVGSRNLIRRHLGLTLSCLAVIFSAIEVRAQSEVMDDPEMQRLIQLYSSIKWEEGPTTVSIGDHAQLSLPDGYQFTGQQGSAIWNEVNQNPPADSLGVIMPLSEEENWFLVFDFDNIGYVKDDEKDNLDADAILQSMQAGAEQSNAFRRKQGWGEISIDGWISPPSYDPQSHNLVWALRVRDSDGGSVGNHSTRLLGREGVMNVTLVADEHELTRIMPAVKQLMTGFEYVPGHKYSEWRSGDKIAEYGLTGLIAGGATIAAVKTGLLGKLGLILAKAGKAIFLGIAALGAGIWKWVSGRDSGPEGAN